MAGLEIQHRTARDPSTGKTLSVPGDMTYEQWGRGVEASGNAGGVGGILEKSNPKLDAELLKELQESGEKHTPENILDIFKTSDGKLVWLETGTDRAGFKHILNQHGDEFAKKGISKGELPELIRTTLCHGKVIGYQGKGTQRPVYEVLFKGEQQRVAVTVSLNGFIIGINPKSSK